MPSSFTDSVWQNQNEIVSQYSFTGHPHCLTEKNNPPSPHSPHSQPRFDPSVRKIPWRREWQPTLVFLPGEFHGQKSLAGYSPRDGKESDATE